MPLFVLDDRLLAAALRRSQPPEVHARVARTTSTRSLRGRGAGLVVRRGDVGARDDRGRAESRRGGDLRLGRRERLRAAPRAELGSRCDEQRIAFEPIPGVTIVPPGDVLPAGGDHFKVFTPYWRRWSEEPLRAVEPPPRRLALPGGLDARAAADSSRDSRRGDPSPDLAGRRRDGGPAAPRRLEPLRRRALRRAPRRPRRRRDVAAQPVPALRLRLAARGARAHTRARPRPLVRPPALLARLPPSGDRRVPRAAAHGLPPARRPLARRRRGARGLEGGPHRLPDRRRRHAPAARARAGCTTARA